MFEKIEWRLCFGGTLKQRKGTSLAANTTMSIGYYFIRDLMTCFATRPSAPTGFLWWLSTLRELN